MFPGLYLPIIQFVIASSMQKRITWTPVRSPRNETRCAFITQKGGKTYQDETAHMVTYLIHGTTHLCLLNCRRTYNTLPQMRENHQLKILTGPQKFRPTA